MSNLKATIEKLTVTPHPNADLLDLAQVGEYRAVVQKDTYHTGEYALYIPEQAVLPAELIEELGLTGRLAGPNRDRVKAIRLRGELSQGIVCRPKGLRDLFPRDGDAVHDIADPELYPAYHAIHGTDFAPRLGITKWIPPVPPHLAGSTYSAPDLLRMFEIEDVKRYPDVFEPGERVIATEKIHGTCCLVTHTDGKTMVSSKGIGENYLALEESPVNLYWRAIKAHGLEDFAAHVAGLLNVRSIGLFGEVYGSGVQDLHYGKNVRDDAQIGYALFDIAFVDAAGVTRWMSYDETSLVYSQANALRFTGESWDCPPRVPVVYRGPYDYQELSLYAQGESMLDPGTMREGLVVRPEVEHYSPMLGGRAVLKFKSPAFLLRGGKHVTEYQ